MLQYFYDNDGFFFVQRKNTKKIIGNRIVIYTQFKFNLTFNSTFI